eukprot:566847-Prorocentrum_minimum.AAC.2
MDENSELEGLKRTTARERDGLCFARAPQSSEGVLHRCLICNWRILRSSPALLARKLTASKLQCTPESK